MSGELGRKGNAVVVARTSLVAAVLLATSTGCMAYHQGPLPNEPKQLTYTQVDGVRLRYADSAEKNPDDLRKPAVVMVHGFAASSDTWLPVIPALQGQHRIVTFDLKGFGWSERPEGDYSNLAQAKLLLGLMKQRGIEHASLIGHSWGTSVVLAAVVEAPERVDRFVLISPYAYNAQIPTFFQWSRAPGVGEAFFSAFYKSALDERAGSGFYDKKWVTQELVDSVESSMARPGTVAAALASARGQDFADLEPRYRSIAKPALIMVGHEDTVAAPQYARKLARELQDARMVEYAECAHFPMIEARVETNRELVAFLDTERLQSVARPAPAASLPEPAATTTPEQETTP